MTYIVSVLLSFIILLFVMQVIFFEIMRNKMIKSENLSYFLSLKKPFHYNRVGYMIFLCVFCYLITGTSPIFSVEWFVFLILFVAMGIVSDAVVQYLILFYSKKRCKKQIEEAESVLNQLTEFTQNMYEDYDYQVSEKKYNEEYVLKNYLKPETHLAVISNDQGKFARNIDPLPEAMFVIEPYTDIQSVKEKFDEDSVKVVSLSSSNQLPFKDEKMDVVACMDCTYTKEEVQRVLKDGGYFVVNQNGTTNYKEFLKLYMPFGMKGAWDAFSCAGTLQNIGMKIINTFEDYGSIRFRTIQALHTYFQKESPDVSDINKYQLFYMKALLDIQRQGFFELTTHRFLVVAQKVSQLKTDIVEG